MLICTLDPPPPSVEKPLGLVKNQGSHGAAEFRNEIIAQRNCVNDNARKAARVSRSPRVAFFYDIA